MTYASTGTAWTKDNGIFSRVIVRPDWRLDRRVPGFCIPALLAKDSYWVTWNRVIYNHLANEFAKLAEESGLPPRPLLDLRSMLEERHKRLLLEYKKMEKEVVPRRLTNGRVETMEETEARLEGDLQALAQRKRRNSRRAEVWTFV